MQYKSSGRRPWWVVIGIAVALLGASPTLGQQMADMPSGTPRPSIFVPAPPPHVPSPGVYLPAPANAPPSLFDMLPAPPGAGVTPVRFARSTDPILSPSDDLVLEPPPMLSPDDPSLPKVKPTGQKDGFLQRLAFYGTWLPSPGGDDLGVSDLELLGTLGFPFPTQESPLLITPGFAVHYFDGPLSTDLPARTYDAWLEIRWLRPISDNLAADLSISPGLFSDFEQDTSEALRLPGRALVIYTWSPELKLVSGVVYLDRRDVKLLPAAGMIWTPHEDLRVELLFPRPKVSRRVFCDGDFERWVYVAGEFGGGSWAIERAGGQADVATYRDFRVILGTETKSPGAINRRLEVGYVFGRELEYDLTNQQVEFDGTVMVRGGLVY